jgi:sulfur carrier protein ThiS
MQVTLKLFASLGAYLPADAERNQTAAEVADGTTVRGLLDAFNVPPPACHLVLLNGHFQPPGRRSEVRLSPGDVIAVWPPVAGG